MLEIPFLLWSVSSRLIVTFELHRIALSCAGFKGVDLALH